MEEEGIQRRKWIGRHDDALYWYLQRRSHIILIGAARLSTESANASAECAAGMCVCGGVGEGEQGRRGVDWGMLLHNNCKNAIFVFN